MTANNQNPWGRVDDDGTVYVKDGGKMREGGQFSDGTPAEALALYERRYADLQGEVKLLETRIAHGTADAQVSKSVEKLAEKLVAPQAVGDLDALRGRVKVLQKRAEVFAQQQREKKAQERAAAVAHREQLVAKAEEIAQQVQDNVKIQWNETAKSLQEIFEKWQEHQRTGGHIPKAQADELWQRFKSARRTFDKERSQYFAAVEAKFKAAREEKEQLVKKAEQLLEKGAEGVKEYRGLLEQWKRAGNAGRKHEDGLWAKFKAAGDAVYGALKEELAVTDEEHNQNLAKKEALLEQAEQLLEVKDHEKARKQLTALQLQWDEIGRVPRDRVREVEGRLSKVEAHVKALEDAHWRATDPEAEARTAGLRGQLESSIAQLETEIASADAGKKTELEQKLKTQREWLAAISK